MTYLVTNMNTNGRSLAALLNERQVAELTGMSIATVRRWRLTGNGPRYVKVAGGVSVRYRCTDIDEWLSAQTTGKQQIRKGGN